MTSPSTRVMPCAAIESAMNAMSWRVMLGSPDPTTVIGPGMTPAASGGASTSRSVGKR